MARNFTSQKPTHQEVQSASINIQNPPAPEKYRGLYGGPSVDIELEENKATPVDGSNSLLRNLSPFVIQVEPPLILGSEPALVGSEVKKGNITGLYGSALRGRTGFLSARSALAMTNYVQGNYGPGTAEEVISRHSAARASGGARYRSGDGVQQTDATGTQEQGKTGEPAVADLQVAVDIATQLKSFLETPPLILLINPQSLAMSYTKIQTFQDRTRFGYIFQAWGEDQPKLSISARCGAFYSGGRGVQFASRRDSASWQNLMTAFQFYRNNGYIHDTVGRSNAHHMVGALSIRYDQWIYFGNMQTFSMGLEESNELGGVTFEMEFVVSAMVDTASPSFNVQPMRKINPDYWDLRYSGSENWSFNRPGELSVFGPSGSGASQVRTGTSSVLVEENGTSLVDPDFKPRTTPTQPQTPASGSTNTGGFRTGATEAEAAVGSASVSEVQPFRSPGDSELTLPFSRQRRF